MPRKPIIRPEGYYEQLFDREYAAIRKAGHGDGMARYFAQLTTDDKRAKDLGVSNRAVGSGDIDIDCAIAGDASISPLSPDFGLF